MSYLNYRKNTLKEMGLNIDNYTDEQIDVILKPLNAPEDYYCDGEISPDQADRIYVKKLANINISREDQIQVLKYYQILI